MNYKILQSKKLFCILICNFLECCLADLALLIPGYEKTVKLYDHVSTHHIRTEIEAILKLAEETRIVVWVSANSVEAGSIREATA